MVNPPVVYFDQPGGIAFPPRAVMPLDELRAVVLEWVRTAERPASVEWLAINDLTWHLTDDGEVTIPERRKNRVGPDVWRGARRHTGVWGPNQST